jgi:excisionase family DNA binding protein
MADTPAPSGRNHVAGSAGTLTGQLVMHTAEEAAKLLKVKRSWLERQAAARKIPFSMLGGSYRFSDEHLAEIVRIHEKVPLSSAPDAARPVRKPRRAQPGGQPSAKVAPLRARPRNGPRCA